MEIDSVVEADAPIENVFEVDSPHYTGLTFSMPTANKLASFIYSSIIITKLSDTK